MKGAACKARGSINVGAKAFPPLMQPPSLSDRAVGSVEDEPAFLREQRTRVLAFIRAMPLDMTSVVGPMIAYHLGFTDRENGAPAAAAPACIHPALFLWACAACGGEAAVAVPVAAAIELLHTFVEVHQDIQNQAHVRRERETLWRVWGVAQGINTGDALHALAFQALTSATAIAPERLLHVGHLVSAALLEIIDAQAAEKRAALVAASMQAGAVVAGSSEAVVQEFGRAGRLLGKALQGAARTPPQAAEAVAVVEKLGLDRESTRVFRELTRYIATTDR